MQLPILRLLRQIGVYPLVAWGPLPAVSLVQDHPDVDAVLPDQGKPTSWELARLLRQHRAARSIHFPKSLRPALAAWLARVPERIGVSESLAGLFNTTGGPFWSAEGPFLLRYHAVLAKAFPGLPPMPFAAYDPGIQVPHPETPYICLMPGSTWPSKTYPATHFRMLAHRIQQEGLVPVILGSREEAETCDQVACEGSLNLCGKTTLKEAAAWLRSAQGAIGNDSGLSHLAAATGTATLGLYGATDPGGSTPWGPRIKSLRLADVPCAPCFKHQCPVPGHPCLAGLVPDLVWEALRDLRMS